MHFWSSAAGIVPEMVLQRTTEMAEATTPEVVMELRQKYCMALAGGITASSALKKKSTVGILLDDGQVLPLGLAPHAWHFAD